MGTPRTDVELIRLHEALRKQAFAEAGSSLVREALAGGAKLASQDADWTVARKKHLETP